MAVRQASTQKKATEKKALSKKKTASRAERSPRETREVPKAAGRKKTVESARGRSVGKLSAKAAKAAAPVRIGKPKALAAATKSGKATRAVATKRKATAAPSKKGLVLRAGPKGAASKAGRAAVKSTRVGLVPVRAVAKRSNGVKALKPARGRAVGRAAALKAKTKTKKKPIEFASAKDVKVLVVDDEPEVLNLLVPFLRAQGYTVTEAQDGDQALEKILTDRPNVVILDVMMPGLSGWEISRYVRERGELDPVRIIMATGIGKETNAATSPLYEADDYIDKPFRLETLHRTVKKVLARLEAGTY